MNTYKCPRCKRTYECSEEDVKFDPWRRNIKQDYSDAGRYYVVCPHCGFIYTTKIIDIRD